MKPAYLHEDELISPLGFSTLENIEALKTKKSGLEKIYHPAIKDKMVAGIINPEKLQADFGDFGSSSNFTKLEQMLLLAACKCLQKNKQFHPSKMALLLSTTKGNISLLEKNNSFPKKRLYLHEMAAQIGRFLGIAKFTVVSNACVSGGLALSLAKTLLQDDKYESILVLGGDLVSNFVVSGFHSLKALSDEPCRPFSKDRKGINLGEAAAAVLVSLEKPAKLPAIKLIGEASANDANHISGPSRTGEGLVKSIAKALQDACVSARQIDYLSAHGTATKYNDEMEAVAFNRCTLQQSPVNSLKAFYGHTLGASALVESILLKQALLKNYLFPSLNSEANGLSKPLNLIANFEEKPLQYALKTASGFGGANLAMVFKKEME